MTWWVGDVIGVLIFTPLLLCFIGTPRSQWQLRINSVALPLVMLSLLVAVLFQLGKSQEQARISAIFEERANLLPQRTAKWNQPSTSKLTKTFKRFFDSSINVTPNDFKLFTQSVFSNHKAILALEWIPTHTTIKSIFLWTAFGAWFCYSSSWR